MSERPYEKLQFYRNICEIRRLIQKITKKFEHRIRLVSQMRDAARSAKQNIREGYRKGTAKEFVHFINISRSSLEELSGDAEDCYEDGLISQETYTIFCDLYTKTDYMIGQYVRSVLKLEAEGKWKVPNKRTG